MAAVHQHGEADGLRAPEVHEGVEGGAYRAAGVQDVVHQYDDAALDALVHARVADHRLLVRRPPRPDVVPVQGDADGAHRLLAAGGAADVGGQALGDRDTARLHADQVEQLVVGNLLDDLRGQAIEDARKLSGVKHVHSEHATFLLTGFTWHRELILPHPPSTHRPARPRRNGRASQGRVSSRSTEAGVGP